MDLNTWLDRERVSTADFARRIDRSPQSVDRYRKGARIPDRATMPIIVKETRGEVTANDFFGIKLPARPKAAGRRAA